jgi:N-acetyl-D-muramate 6-phosphate phosphatase
MTRPVSVMFDVDGVLLDSLAPHLQICEDKNLEYGLGLTIPNANDFKEMVRRGTKISPMKFFFRAVGFPDLYANLAFDQYKETFMRDYTPKPFPEVAEMLTTLTLEGLILGIVTSNVRSNVDQALGPAMRLFHPDIIFAKDCPAGDSKVEALLSAARRLDIDTAKIVYVGDQRADWTAAREAGAGFLGVTYGWGIREEDEEFPLARSVMGVAKEILEMSSVSPPGNAL